MWWPSLNNDITTTVEACTSCQTYKPSLQREPLQTDTNPEWPFEIVSADLFSVAGKTFLLYADRLSGWASVAKYGKDTTTSATIKRLRDNFACTGVPRRLRTDEGPQFASAEFEEFCKIWNIQHELSSPHHAISNGHAEAHVKSLKRLIQKTAASGDIDSDEFTLGLLELRNMPRADGLSPAEILMGRTLRSTLPAHRKLYTPEWNAKIREWDLKHSLKAEMAKESYDSRSKELTPLDIGYRVRIQDHATKKWTLTGTIVAKKSNRCYYVRLPSGRVLWRNRRYLFPIPERDEPVSETETMSQPKPEVKTYDT